MDPGRQSELIRQAERMVQELCHRSSDKEQFVLVVWRLEFCSESVRTRKFSFRPRRSGWREKRVPERFGYQAAQTPVVQRHQGNHQHGA